MINDEEIKIEILAGKMENYFKRTGIQARKAWEGREYEIWDIDKTEFKKLVATEDESYEINEWWRQAAGSTAGEVNAEYIVNGERIKAWDGEWRKNLMEEEEDIFERKYKSLTQYLRKEMGCGQPSNIVALAVDIAKQNGMTMAELFKKYEGGAVDER